MKLFKDDNSIFVTLTEWTTTYGIYGIDGDGYLHDRREQFNPHKGKKAKVVAIERLNDRYCAVQISAWEEDKKEEVAV